jgi:hypothetical protein
MQLFQPFADASGYDIRIARTFCEMVRAKLPDNVIEFRTHKRRNTISRDNWDDFDGAA